MVTIIVVSETAGSGAELVAERTRVATSGEVPGLHVLPRTLL